jgi:hypothetical protein
VALASFYENDAEDIPVEEPENSKPIEERPVRPPAPDPKPVSGSVSSSRYIIII